MDRPELTTVAVLTGFDDQSTSGWDAHTVWQERVRAPRAGVAARAGTPRITLADQSAGWDPLETWRLRVQRLRKQPA